MKDIRNKFSKKKEDKAINRILLDIKNLFQNEQEEIYYKPVGVSNFWNNNYIGYERNGDRNKTLSVEEYVNKIRPYLKYIINNIKKLNTWKIQLTTANNFLCSVNNDEECVMHLRSDNMKIKTNDEADKVTKELFDSVENR